MEDSEATLIAAIITAAATVGAALIATFGARGGGRETPRGIARPSFSPLSLLLWGLILSFVAPLIIYSQTVPDNTVIVEAFGDTINGEDIPAVNFFVLIPLATVVLSIAFPIRPVVAATIVVAIHLVNMIPLFPEEIEEVAKIALVVIVSNAIAVALICRARGRRWSET